MEESNNNFLFLFYVNVAPDCQWTQSGQRPGTLGGRVWPITKAAWQAMIWDNKPGTMGRFVRCGAIVFGKHYVLTAAHCVDSITEDEFRSRRLVVKTAKQSSRAYRVDPGEQTRAISRIAIHRQFNNITFENDIAVLYLESALHVESKNTMPVRLPDVTRSDFCLEQPDSSALLTGWGRGSPLRSARTLRGVHLPLINATICRRAYPSWPITRGMICSGAGLGQRDTCHGDSGGPIVAYNQKRNAWVLLGIIIWGSERCAQPNKYIVSTRVSHYIEWINTATTCMKLGKPVRFASDKTTLSFIWRLCIAQHKFFVP